MSVIGSRKSAKGIIVGLLSLLTKPKFCFSVLKITVTIGEIHHTGVMPF